MANPIPIQFNAPELLAQYQIPDKDQINEIGKALVNDSIRWIEAVEKERTSKLQLAGLERLAQKPADDVRRYCQRQLASNDALQRQQSVYSYLSYRDLLPFKRAFGLITDEYSFTSYDNCRMFTRNSAHSAPLANVLDYLERTDKATYNDVWRCICAELYKVHLPAPTRRTNIGRQEERIMFIGQEANVFSLDKNTGLYNGKSMKAGGDLIQLMLSNPVITQRLNLLDRLVLESVCTALLASVEDEMDVLDRRIYPVRLSLPQIFQIMASSQNKPTSKQRESIQRALAKQGSTRIVIDVNGHVSPTAAYSWDADYQRDSLAIGAPLLHFNDITVKRTRNVTSAIEILECPILLRYALLYSKCIDQIRIDDPLKKNNKTEMVLAIEEFWNDRLIRCKRMIRKEAGKKKKRASNVLLSKQMRTLSYQKLYNAVEVNGGDSRTKESARETLRAFVEHDLNRDQSAYKDAMKQAGHGKGARSMVRCNGYLKSVEYLPDGILLRFE